MENRKQFIDYLSNITDFREDLIEKDLLLHLLLLNLEKNDFFRDYLFKGGSCLIKCYLDYYRFSVDLDLTYKHQDKLENKSQNEIRRFLSKGEIERVIKLIKNISKRIDLDFKAEKPNQKYIEYGGSNKTITLKLWYDSVLEKEEFIKIQINFVENILFGEEKRQASTLCPENDKLARLFPSQYNEYSKNVKIDCYNIREVLCEKIRSILTRKALKARDFVDIYYIANNFDVSLDEVKNESIQKIEFILDLYKKYRKNIKGRIEEVSNIKVRREEYLLIEPLDEGFNDYLIKLKNFLETIKKELRGGKKND